MEICKCTYLKRTTGFPDAGERNGVPCRVKSTCRETQMCGQLQCRKRLQAVVCSSGIDRARETFQSGYWASIRKPDLESHEVVGGDESVLKVKEIKSYGQDVRSSGGDLEIPK